MKVRKDGVLEATDTQPVAGVVAHDAVVSGNPILTGLESRITNSTAVGDGDLVRAIADNHGRQITARAIEDLIVEQATSISSTTETTILTAGASGVKHHLTLLWITNRDHQSYRVAIRDDTAGTVRFHLNIAPKGGAAPPIVIHPIIQTNDNDNWTAEIVTGTPDNGIDVFVQAEKRTS